jgi:hypothetical protein
MSLFLRGGSHFKIRFLSSIRLHPNPPAKISFVIQTVSSIVTASAIGMLLAKYPLPNGDYGLLSFVEVPVELLTAGSQAADGTGFSYSRRDPKSKFLSFFHVYQVCLVLISRRDYGSRTESIWNSRRTEAVGQGTRVVG